MQSAPTLARLAWLLPALCLIGPARSAEPIEPIPITVGVAPVARLTRIVGGPFVRVQTLLPPRRSPHRYTPTGNQIRALAEAKLYVGSGAGFESAWVEKLSAANPGLAVVDVGTGAAGSTAGYPWASPSLTKQLGWRSRDALSALDPANAQVYRSRTAALSRDLDALDQDLRAKLASATHRRFIAADPVWGPFAETYGLVQIAATPKSLTPGRKAANLLAYQARREGVRVVLMRPGFDPQVGKAVAAKGPARVYAVNPLAANSRATLRHIASLMAESEFR